MIKSSLSYEIKALALKSNATLVGYAFRKKKSLRKNASIYRGNQRGIIHQ